MFLQRNDVIALTAGILGFLADYLLNLTLSHTLEVHEFGDFRIARAFAFLCGSLVLLGGDRAAPRMLAVSFDKADFGFVSEYLRFYGVLGLLASGAIIAGTWSFCAISHDPGDFCAHHAVAIMTFAIPFMAAGALAGRTLQTVGQTFLATMPWRVGAPVILIIALFLAHLVKDQVALEEIVWLACLTIMGITFAQWIMVRHHALKVIVYAAESRKPRAWLQISLPMMGAFLVTVGLGQSDLYFLEWLATEQSVGHYAAAFTTAHFILLIQTSIIALYSPLVSRDLKKSVSVQASTAMRQGQRVLALVLTPVIFVLTIEAVPIMRFFGSVYEDAALVLQLLVIGNGAWALAALSALWLQYRGRGMTVMLIALITLSVDSLLNLLLIPKFDMLGAAGSSAFTSICAAVATTWLARRASGTR